MIVGISSPTRTALYRSLLTHSCTALDSLRNHHSHPSLLNTALLHPEPALSSCRALQQAHEPICRVSRQSSLSNNNDRLSKHLCKTLPRAFDNATAMLIPSMCNIGCALTQPVTHCCGFAQLDHECSCIQRHQEESMLLPSLALPGSYARCCAVTMQPCFHLAIYYRAAQRALHAIRP
jgi:hypothetical protein